MPINGAGITVGLAGGIMAYSAVKNVSITKALQAFVKGNPLPATVDPLITNGTNPGTLASTQADALASGGTNGAKVVQLAQSQLGKPYVFDTPINPATANPDTFDCSGLTMWTYFRIGILLTHYTGTQWGQLAHRPLSEAQPGDLLFYGSSGPSSYHVAINIGGGQLIEAPEPGVPVHVRGWAIGDGDLIDEVGVCP